MKVNAKCIVTGALSIRDGWRTIDLSRLKRPPCSEHNDSADGSQNEASHDAASGIPSFGTLTTRLVPHLVRMVGLARVALHPPDDLPRHMRFCSRVHVAQSAGGRTKTGGGPGLFGYLIACDGQRPEHA